jgi:hypothetical protein
VTKFDRNLARQIRDSAFAECFAQTGEAWDVGLQLRAAHVSPHPTRRCQARRPVRLLKSGGWLRHTWTFLAIFARRSVLVPPFFNTLL